MIDLWNTELYFLNHVALVSLTDLFVGYFQLLGTLRKDIINAAPVGFSSRCQALLPGRRMVIFFRYLRLPSFLLYAALCSGLRQRHYRLMNF